MPLSKKDMLKILEATEFPKNKGRTNNLQHGQTFSKSMVLERVRKSYSSRDGKVCKVESRNNKKSPILLKVAKQLLREAPGVNYKFEAITINENQPGGWLTYYVT